MQIRITTGSAKNKRLKAPNIEGFRAVQEVAKSAVFAILEDKVIDSVCLDLFCGSGNMGMEALSRGAAWCDFVDSDKKSNYVVQENLENCGFADKGEVFGKEAVKYVANTEKEYDIIFTDPFYEDTNHIFLMQNIEETLKKNGVVVFFHGDNLKMEKVLAKTKLEVIDERRFGKSFVTFIKNKS